MRTLNEFRKDEKGIFGLTAVQQFFVVILGIALLAYVIVVIMGSLSNSTILPSSSDSAINESDLNGNIAFANSTGYTLSKTSLDGANSFVITAVWGDGNQSNGSQLAIARTPSGFTALIPAANYSVTSAGVLKNGTSFVYPNVSASYTYTFNSNAQINTRNILGNTSTGITGFFTSINPIYAILAVLVIILVLVVLVRVVSTGQGGGRETPQL